MKRDIWSQLKSWKESRNRKPLLVKGARQVGKTYIIKQFAQTMYENYVYINCDKDERISTLFEHDFDTSRIIRMLELLSKEKIQPEKTCIFIDEIQEVPRALASLKYFCEEASQYHIIVAGSLMGIAMHKGSSFPVGKVDLVEMYPMGYAEFLDAMGEGSLRKLLMDGDWSAVQLFKHQYIDLLRQYYFVGGMPEVVSAYVSDRTNLSGVRQIQQAILNSYELDISKHAPTEQIVRIRAVWNSIPSQLAKDNKKFIYGVIKQGARAKEFELAIEWLKDYGIVYKIHRISAPKLPLKNYEDLSAFKLFVLDTGLFGALNQMPPEQMLTNDNVFEESKGSFTELYVLQQLKLCRNTPVYYWSNESSSAELDFIVQRNSRTIPIEVKAEENLKSKSLRNYILSNPGLKGVRFSMSDYREQDWMANVPLYAVESWLTQNDAG